MKIEGAATLHFDTAHLRGAEKRVNRRGGITIPVALRRMLHIHGSDKFAMYALDNGDIYMKCITAHCMICGKVTVVKQGERYVYCDECLAKQEAEPCENT